ncbi:MAG: fumarylacetoacetate hydrolase family protein [Bacteroidetes bacterium]|nr:fumarylacetoacetate hydrolase family protein [Bacteroidota bacterium]MCB0845315.1 fumarylacetoacetate hydrolase family protein [Bacteroidota bacterium]
MKIICVGRNYREHAKELNNPVPDSPMIFLKPDTAVLRENKDFYYPEFTRDLHYECELVVRISREGKFIQENFVNTYIDGVGLGIDFTARDLQSEAKKKGWPWTFAKMFNDSAPVSEFLSPEDFPDLQNVRFTCHINGEEKQKGHTADMIFSVSYLISYVSQFITLKKGDLIFTGTPEGVGPVHVNDRIEGFLEGKKMLDFHVR